MARPSRFAPTAKFDILETQEALNAQLNDKEERLIVVLFNRRRAEENTLETRMTAWIKDFETKHHVRFFKYVLEDGNQDVKVNYKIQRGPAVVIFHKGIEKCTINDFAEANIESVKSTAPNGQSPDEIKLQDKIKELEPKK